MALFAGKKVNRPLLRYFGGKWRLAPWILQSIPPHRVYVEPFGGAGSVLLRKPRAYAEIYNDLDGEIVNVFRVARERGHELREQLRLTPFARAEYRAALVDCEDGIERARRTIIKSYMGFGASSIQRVTGFRANSTRSGTTPAHDWANFPAALEAITERLSGVAIENRCALAVMRAHDSPDTVHYVDPPYMADTRGSRDVYRHEMRDEQHIELLTFLKTLSGTVILSGYESAIYLDHLSHWIIRSKDSFADGARPRKEIIFMNRAAPPSGLFAQIATPYSPSCEKG